MTTKLGDRPASEMTVREAMARDFCLSMMADRAGMEAIRKATNSRNTIEKVVCSFGILFADELLRQLEAAP